ncbi:hypothetical protein SBA1_980047 [Candidatus Sulfotelmatobacter kueseliae]|uniref:Uncharacterized protein n=1 Tax=Candidatus Sulfotelmatobacter kueseliae TaxID=2042962 RepID=A0A2U3LDP0_9BACT|nr:hypothetical protein SBA1_980047 [Candidatus Sulfotelmatobacter kueseliae]
MELAVHVIDALPLESVVAVVAEGVQVAPDDGGANVTVTPVAGEPLEVTFTPSAVGNASVIVWVCVAPPVAVIAMVGGGGALELLQPVRKPKARETKAKPRMPYVLRFIATPLSQPRVYGSAEIPQFRAGCGW